MPELSHLRFQDREQAPLSTPYPQLPPPGRAYEEQVPGLTLVSWDWGCWGAKGLLPGGPRPGALGTGCPHGGLHAALSRGGHIFPAGESWPSGRRGRVTLQHSLRCTSDSYSHLPCGPPRKGGSPARLFPHGRRPLPWDSVASFLYAQEWRLLADTGGVSSQSRGLREEYCGPLHAAELSSALSTA